MNLTKYPQSCFLIELKDKRILIDPGSYVYADGSFKPEDWKKIDVILYTHEHEDHLDINALKIILQNNQPKIITNAACQKMLNEAGIPSLTVEPGEMTNVENIEFKGIKAKHGLLPSGDKPPEVIGFLIDRMILHTGDSIDTDKVQAEIVLICMCGQVCYEPKNAIKYLKKVKPSLVIPMHYHNDNFITDTQVFTEALDKAGIKYRILKNKEAITL